MRFQVPQNVQREDTVFLNVTFKQLAICLFGGGIAYVVYLRLYNIYEAIVWGPAVGLVIIITAIFAFVKISNMTFVNFLLYLVEFIIKPKVRVFSHNNLIYRRRFNEDITFIDPNIKKKENRKGELDSARVDEILNKINFENEK